MFSCGDILFGKLRPYFHKVGIAPVNGVCSTDILVLKPKAENGTAFLLSIVSSNAFINYVSAAAEGTKMPRTDWKTMSIYPVLIPPPAVIKQFSETVGLVIFMPDSSEILQMHHLGKNFALQSMITTLFTMLWVISRRLREC